VAAASRANTRPGMGNPALNRISWSCGVGFHEWLAAAGLILAIGSQFLRLTQILWGQLRADSNVL
jgi:hypothetical protein